MLLWSKHRTSSARPPAEPRTPRMITSAALLAAVLAGQLLTAPAVTATPPARTANTPVGQTADTTLTTTDVTFHGSGDLPLHGTVVTPAAPGPPRPGMVLVNGAGPHLRDDLLREAEAFARGGIVTLIHDKRTVGYSLTQRSYSVLADDALAAVEALRAHDGVDPGMVGVWGLSEGGWVAPLAASRSGDVAFLVTVGANGVTPTRQQSWANDLHLRDAGVSGSLLRTARTFMRQGVGVGMFPEADYDPVPVLEQVEQPVLALWGGQEKATPPGDSVRIFQQVLADSGNEHATLRVFPDAEHALHRAADGGYTRLDDLAPGYAELVTSWVQAVAAGEPPASNADEAPQDRPSAALAPLAWYESPWIVLGAVVLFAVAFASYPLTAAARRLTGRRGAPPARRPARWLAATGPVTVLGCLGYLVVLAASAAEAAGPVVLGRPVPWLVLQLLAVAVVAASAATALAWRRHRSELTGGAQVRLGLLLSGGVAFVPWALYWGLLLP